MADKSREVAVIRLTKVTPKKYSVRFDTEEKDPIVSNVYVNRLAAMKLLGVQDLEAVKGIEVSVHVVA